MIDAIYQWYVALPQPHKFILTHVSLPAAAGMVLFCVAFLLRMILESGGADERVPSPPESKLDRLENLWFAVQGIACFIAGPFLMGGVCWLVSVIGLGVIAMNAAGTGQDVEHHISAGMLLVALVGYGFLVAGALSIPVMVYRGIRDRRKARASRDAKLR